MECRALVLLHDEHGHPLLATTHRGDQHLTVGLPTIIARYEHNEEHVRVKRIIVDREGMTTEFLVSLHVEGRTVVTILRTNQYRDMTSFCDVGTFLPLSINAKGQLVREVAPARISLPRPDHPGERLCLQVALIRDLRRVVPVGPREEYGETIRFPEETTRTLLYNRELQPTKQYCILLPDGLELREVLDDEGTGKSWLLYVLRRKRETSHKQGGICLS